ncbi:MAG: dihydrofolate reductase [Burkholderiaceae bacterium]|nr:dihydrofolate reductase [Burkholderiaceae bacterium]
MPPVSLIAAVARNGAIGRGNDLLWTDPADQRHFRQTTMGYPVVMGRRTWDSLPARYRPLPGRRNIVITRNVAFDAPGAETAPGLDSALALLADAPRVFVIGGGELYALALPAADTLVLTEIDAELDGDTFFPAFDSTPFDEVERLPQRAADGTPFAFVTYRRRTQAVD